MKCSPTLSGDNVTALLPILDTWHWIGHTLQGHKLRVLPCLDVCKYSKLTIKCAILTIILMQNQEYP